ncbi:hypothetical protein FQN50_004740 [Emmonsiellopsis sp. PD_5]|nr:hypothetical protein FQN50_004740 [Emmonsiellopsis sp. PD_5]
MFQKLPIAILAALATTSTAIPLDNPYPCNAHDTSSVDGVKALLDSTGCIIWLDLEFNSTTDGEKDWVNSLYERTFPADITGGSSPLSGCGGIDGDCNPNSKCSDYPDEMSYWVYRSVAALHSKANTVRSQLLWEGWLASLSIDRIAEDFSPPEPDDSWKDWVSAAFEIAGAIAENVPLPGASVLSGSIGIASLAFDSIKSPEADKIDTTSVETALGSMVGNAGNYVATILNAATGHGDPNILPSVTLTTLQYPTSRFLNDPSILVDQDKDDVSFTAVYSEFSKRITKKLVDLGMKSVWYLLFGDSAISEADCNFKGSYWLEAKPGDFRCFYLTIPGDPRFCKDENPDTCDPGASWRTVEWFDDKVYDKLIDTYGFDLRGYYINLIDCYNNGNNGELDMTATTPDGLLSRCFYNQYVRFGKVGEDWRGVPTFYFD